VEACRHASESCSPWSRGCKVDKLATWLKGPEWLAHADNWPSSLTVKPSKESESEAKLTREVFAAAVEKKDELDELLEKHSFWKTIRVTAWIRRFLRNCQIKKEEIVTGPLITRPETDDQVKLWVKREQQKYCVTGKFEEDQLRLNLQVNNEGLYECRGRIQGSYLVFLPPQSVFSEKVVQDAHILTLHGGVGLTMSNVRDVYWIPRLRQLAKKVIKQCYGCKNSIQQHLVISHRLETCLWIVLKAQHHFR
jgi:hypothetical protein